MKLRGKVHLDPKLSCKSCQNMHMSETKFSLIKIPPSLPIACPQAINQRRDTCKRGQGIHDRELSKTKVLFTVSPKSSNEKMVHNQRTKSKFLRSFPSKCAQRLGWRKRLNKIAIRTLSQACYQLIRDTSSYSKDKGSSKAKIFQMLVHFP